MTRWSPDGRVRLAQAALDLYAMRGYDQTTVAEIAERAGLTERTFFRHFADKKEVLFAGSKDLQTLMAAAVAAAPQFTSPIDAVAAGLLAAGAVFGDERRDYATRRHSVITANAELRERELIKMASLVSAIGDALRRRGVAEPAASLTAEAGIAVFRVAFARWVGEGNALGWEALVRESMAELRIAVGA